MKKILLFIVALMSTVMISAQDQAELKPASFSEVIKVDSASKEQLSQYMRRWAASVYNNPNKAVKYDNNGEEMLISGSIEYAPHSATLYYQRGFLKYDMTIQFRDGRMKVTMTNFYHTTVNPQSQDIGILYNREVTAEEAKNIPNIKGLILPRSLYNQGSQELYKLAKSNWEVLIQSIKDNIAQQKENKVEDDW